MRPSAAPRTARGVLAALAARALSRRELGRLVERFSEARLPPAALSVGVRLYARVLGIDLAEAAKEAREYRSFDAFFTRRLRPGARPIDPAPGAVVSPCDGVVQAAGPIPPSCRVPQVKGLDYELGALLGEDAGAFVGGSFATIYLSPGDYHRVHAPADGHLLGARCLGGAALPVNGLTVGRVADLYVGNVRIVADLDAGPLGRLALVLVGAANVGRLELSPLGFTARPGDPPRSVEASPPPQLRRGRDIGAFHLGSTVVLATTRPAQLVPGLAEGSQVRVGQPLWMLDSTR